MGTFNDSDSVEDNTFSITVDWRIVSWTACFLDKVVSKWPNPLRTHYSLFCEKTCLV